MLVTVLSQPWRGDTAMMGRIDRNNKVPQGELGSDVKVGYQEPMRKEYAANLKIGTAQDLIKAMGLPPKDGFTLFGHRFRESTDYKAVLQGLESYRGLSAEFSETSFRSANPKNISILETALEEVKTHAQKYIDDNATNPKKAGRVLAMTKLIQAANTELGEIRQLNTMDRNSFPPAITVGDVRNLVANGFSDAWHLNTELTKNTLKEELKPFGSGQLNTVFLAKYDLGGRTEERILKPLVPSKNPQDRVDPEYTAGIDPKHLMIAQRNIASSVVADLLGGTALLPRSDIVAHDGKLYLAMPIAKGEDLVTSRPLVTEKSIKEGRSCEGDDPQQVELLLKESNLVRVGVDQEGKTIYGENADIVRDVPMYTDGESDVVASIQSQLLDLQVIDLLCGQTDRTPRNIMVQVGQNAVTVTAIDHDCSFGEDPAPHVNFAPALLNTSPWPGLPPVMTRSMYDKLTELTPNGLRTALEQAGLKGDQIDQAVTRLGVLKDHATKLENAHMVIDNAKIWRHEESQKNLSQFMSDNDTGGASYIRQFLVAKSNSLEDFKTVEPLNNDKHLLG